MNSKLITVIVPCYNIEKYIERCIESIEKQTYKNIEIIAVDDGSKDNTFEILKECKEKYSNLQIYQNNKNSGAAYSRNFAIQKSKGEYIGFVDSDDYITQDYYEKLMQKITEENADVAVADIEIVYENNKYPSILVKPCKDEYKTKISFINNGLSASPCNKLIKKELLDIYPFLEGKINEDVASILPVLVKANKIVYVEGIKYSYIQRENSVQNSEVTLKRLEMFDAIDTCFKRIQKEENYEEYKEAILYQQVLLMYMAVIPKQKEIAKRKELLEKFMDKQEKYNLYKNKYIKEFINQQPQKERKYYKKMAMCLKNKQVDLANKIIEEKQMNNNIKEKIKDIIRIIIKRTVIKRNITIEDLEKKAKKQAKKQQGQVKISVVIPNYNYENFLIPRIYSILYQTEKIYEIIILDDNSKDNSRELIDKIVDRLKPYIKIQKIYNKENSGCAFKQWKKGFEIARGDYVWIAEADDCCQKTLLTNIIKPIKQNKDIYISYADTAFINAWDKIILPTIKPEIDIRKTGHWDSNFVDNGLEEIENYTFLNCIIANVSSCLIKKENYDDIFEKIIEYKQAGDWLFYINVMKRGKIAFCNKPLNYYRLHGNNVTSVTKKQKHFDEIVKIHEEVRDIIKMTDWHENEINKRYDFLKRVWELEEKNNEEN
ncbi:MAG: glycosyltransferase family 2 protein [Clostridia bacterium]|nr:glycosyltransferase family 2 protein [Clostridia bacterium]